MRSIAKSFFHRTGRSFAPAARGPGVAILCLSATISIALPAHAGDEVGVGEVPTGCNTNAFNADISVLGGGCEGVELTYAISLSNPLNPNDPPFKNCQARNVRVRFWAPNNPPNNLPDICASTNETIELTPPGGITMLPPASEFFIGGPALPELLFTPPAPGLVTAWMCVDGISDTSAVGTPILNARAIDTSIFENPTCSVSGDTDICGTSTSEFCATPVGGSPPYTFAWSGPAGFVPPGNQNCTGPINIPGLYTVTVTDANGCSTTCDRTLTVEPPPPCSIFEGADTICLRTSTTWCATLGEGLTYQWTGPSGFSSTQQCITISSSGEYCVTVTAPDGCASLPCCRTLTVENCDCLPDRIAHQIFCGAGAAGLVPLTCAAWFLVNASRSRRRR